MGSVDLSYLEDITGSDSGVMIEMIDLMLSDTPRHLSTIKQAFQEEKWAELGAVSHKLKPTFLYVGLTELNEITQELELCAKQGKNIDTIPDLINKLETGFEEVIGELKQKREELS